MKRRLHPRRLCRAFFGAIALIFFVASFAVPSEASDSDREAALRGELSRLTEEIDGLRNELRAVRQQARSFAQELDRFDKEIRLIELSLERSERTIAETAAHAAEIEAAIASEEEVIERAQGMIGAILRDIAVADDESPLEVVFSSESLSHLLDDVVAKRQLERALLARLDDLRARERDLLLKREELSKKRTEEEELERLLAVERDELLVQRKLRSELLAETRGREEAFANRLKEEEANAAKIRTELYLLADLRKAIPFGDAYAIAKKMADAVGIRPAFLLAVLQKESRLGALVGNGYWRTDMHPRDWQAFLEITGELGLDPDKVPVSRKPSYGWGGAMGPAQFLPQTWLHYRDRIADLTGHHPPSPWVIEDAFAAAALKLAAGGATTKTPEAEWRAAMMYFAGGNWQDPAYAFYGDAVEELTSFFQRQIDILEQTNGTPS
jgi:peptidoglycan hydrolase CwlO-like protein